MIMEISANEKGHVTEIHPFFLYYMDREDALSLDMSHNDPKVEIRRLDPSNREDRFIVKNWKYSLPGTEIVMPKCLSRNASGGAFVHGKCVCGVYIPAIGFLSALYTIPEYRGKGYAKLVMKYALKEYAKDGFLPCSSAEFQNRRSVKFHECLGLKVAVEGNGILIRNLFVD